MTAGGAVRGRVYTASSQGMGGVCMHSRLSCVGWNVVHRFVLVCSCWLYLPLCLCCHFDVFLTHFALLRFPTSSLTFPQNTMMCAAEFALRQRNHILLPSRSQYNVTDSLITPTTAKDKTCPATLPTAPPALPGLRS